MRSTLGSTLLYFMFDGEHEMQVARCTVVQTLDPVIILGYGFLKSSGTLAMAHLAKRVRKVVTTAKRGFRMRLLDNDNYDDNLNGDKHGLRLHSLVNGEHVTAVPDSGSGIMAMSLDCAMRLGLQVDTDRQTRVMFVDGTTTLTKGTVSAAWSFDSAAPGSGPLSYEWHVIENLPVEVILSVDFLMDHDIFGNHQHALMHRCQPHSQHDIFDVFGIYEVPHGNVGLEDLAHQYISDSEYMFFSSSTSQRPQTGPHTCF